MLYEASHNKAIFKDVPMDKVSELAKHANCLFIRYNINGIFFERLVTNLEIRRYAQGKTEVAVSSKPWSLGKKEFIELYTDRILLETLWGSFYVDVNFMGKRGNDE